MTTNDRDLQALTYLAGRLRDETYGCNDWDAAGTFSVFKSELLGTNLLVAVERVVGHATDPEAKTPGAIKRPFTPTPDRPTMTPPKPHEACSRCGRTIAECRTAAVACGHGSPKRDPGRPPTDAARAARDALRERGAEA